MGTEIVNWQKVKAGNLVGAAKDYVKVRRLRRAFDKVADRVEFIEELEKLKGDMMVVQNFLRNEMRLLESGRLSKEKAEADVVAQIKGYSVFDWARLVRKWQRE
jgi:hypothetical protein